MHRKYYDTLGVPPDADAATIKKAFRKLAHELHPDRNKGDKALEEKFKEVNRAYEVLGDDDKRKLYDEFGEDAEKLGFDPEKTRQYRQYRQGGGRGFDQGVDFEDILSQMFNGGGGFGGGGGFRGGGGPARGRDMQAEMSLDFRTAVRGGERVIGIDGRSVTVRIPPGVKDGGNLRLRGQGLPGPRGGPSGDLVLAIQVQPDPLFEREDDDLIVEVPITVGEALRGGSVEVPTLDGQVRVKVPAGAQTGQTLRVRGKGVVRPKHPPGDLHVKLRVELPDLRDRLEDPALTQALDTLEATYGRDIRQAWRARAGV